MDRGGGASGGSRPGVLEKIFSLSLVAPEGNATCSIAFCQFPEMWYGVFLWALVSSILFHIPAGLLALYTLRRHSYGKYMSVSILLMGIVGPITAGTLTSAAIAGVYRAAGKEMTPFVALMLGVGQSCCVVIISFLRILATL
ncbi:LOW QUALITY PROTEIN: transmembrane protein 170A [Heteronotia binoei]|uniref:LOW QUALITY PROTEIN: transmembrane protein 170A n=1 Tax=Heteronotia binoei TaxID=13085 RepID=UPI00292E3D30|nr:LOW QUALITY PROTEIN: transmembrane protein 170A [Heteronotia binoei]